MLLHKKYFTIVLKIVLFYLFYIEKFCIYFSSKCKASNYNLITQVDVKHDNLHTDCFFYLQFRYILLLVLSRMHDFNMLQDMSELCHYYFHLSPSSATTLYQGHTQPVMRHKKKNIIHFHVSQTQKRHESPIFSH